MMGFCCGLLKGFGANFDTLPCQRKLHIRHMIRVLQSTFLGLPTISPGQGTHHGHRLWTSRASTMAIATAAAVAEQAIRAFVEIRLAETRMVMAVMGEPLEIHRFSHQLKTVYYGPIIIPSKPSSIIIAKSNLMLADS